jgi:uncharacterized protein YigE (DUF2233 family)
MPKARTIAFLVLAATSLVDPIDSALAQAQPCRLKEYTHNAYTVCEVDLSKHTVRLYWQRSDGTPYAYLSSLPRDLEREAGAVMRLLRHWQFPHEAEWDLLYRRR